MEKLWNRRDFFPPFYREVFSLWGCFETNLVISIFNESWQQHKQIKFCAQTALALSIPPAANECDPGKERRSAAQQLFIPRLWCSRLQGEKPHARNLSDADKCAYVFLPSKQSVSGWNVNITNKNIARQFISGKVYVNPVNSQVVNDQ